jgi:hypothetical protein
MAGMVRQVRRERLLSHDSEKGRGKCIGRFWFHVCIIEGQASVKRYRDDGKENIWLENNDGKYQPEECHFVGVVIELNRKVR